MKRLRTILYGVLLAIAALVDGTLAQAGDAMLAEPAWQEGQITESFKPTSPPTLPKPLVAPGPLPPQPTAPPPSNVLLEGDDPIEEFGNVLNWLQGRLGWQVAIDYRYRAFVGSDVTSRFETSIPGSANTMYSELNFPINSSWHGLRLAVDEPNWGAHFEWMAPQQSIDGHLTDYDYLNRPDDSLTLSEIGITRENWLDGQMIDLGIEYQISQCTLNLPIETWPLLGFRWQRFHLMGFDGQQLYDGRWISPPAEYPGDVINFNQQFYTLYFGLQFRTRVRSALLTLQADGGAAWGYNAANYYYRTGDLYTMESMTGGSWHIGFTAEVPISERFCFGFQYDHIGIRGYGTHRYQNLPLNEYGVSNDPTCVSSCQNSIMAFIRYRM
jgi:hypothetical protein